MLIVGEMRQGIYRSSLYYYDNFLVNLKLLQS